MLIVSSNNFNDSKINTVLAAVITSNLHLSNAPDNVVLPKKSAKLAKDSVVNVSQIITLDKTFLTEKILGLNSQQLNALNAGLKLVLAL